MRLMNGSESTEQADTWSTKSVGGSQPPQQRPSLSVFGSQTVAWALGGNITTSFFGSFGVLGQKSSSECFFLGANTKKNVSQRFGEYPSQNLQSVERKITVH